MDYFKDFETWNTVKQRINKDEHSISIRAGEIRWVAIGVNIGSEIDGKGVSFTRPALIINVSGSSFALIVPMSTKVKDKAGYHQITWKNRQVALCIHQTRVVSQKRIFSRLGKLSNTKLLEYKNEITKFFDL